MEKAPELATMLSCHCISVVIRNSKKIPAVTIVAAWSKALTGVGAAIASAIQPENGRLVDLVKAAKIIEELKLTIGLFKYSRTK